MENAPELIPDKYLIDLIDNLHKRIEVLTKITEKQQQWIEIMDVKLNTAKARIIRLENRVLEKDPNEE